MNTDGKDANGLILVADDDDSFAQAFSQMLVMRGYRAVTTTEPAAITRILGTGSFDLLTLDLDWGLDTLSGLDILREVLARDPLLPVVVITEHASIATAVEATRQGAFNYIEKMLDREKILLTIRNAIESGRLKRENRAFLREIQQKYEIIGNSHGMEVVREQIRKAGPTESVVLITGESGTGKELVARQIHYASTRRDQKFVSVDAGTLAETLADSELFGHSKGAFTGATHDRRGLIEEAERGTLFLDEISNASLALQAKLLHLIQEREYRRVGANDVRRCNIRIIAASNQDLPFLVQTGKFRSDLYFRLRVIEIHIPPLNQRKDDISPLVSHFAAVKSRQSYGKERALTSDAINLLWDYGWPGNIRELENAVERIIVLSSSDSISAEEVKSILGGLWMEKDPGLKSLNEMTHAFKRECIIKAMNLAEGHIAHAADILQIDRTHLYKLINEYHLKDISH